MEFRQIQYFHSIVDTGSFSAAAVELFISQSSLSKVIIALDEHRFDLVFTRSNYLNYDQYASLEIYKDKLLVVVAKNNRHEDFHLLINSRWVVRPSKRIGCWTIVS